MGSILLFSNMMVHRSYENMSDKIRWSMDLRYTVGDEYRDEIYSLYVVG